MLARVNENVVKINNESTNIYDQITMFLKNKGRNSESTRKAYEKDIRRFFRIVKNKEIEHLTIEDIQITLDDFEEFIDVMYESDKYNNKTINRNNIAVKVLLKYLYSKHLVEDISYIIANQVQKLPETKNKYDAYTLEEVFQFAELVKNDEKGLIKYYLILFSLDTCIRKSAILNLKWKDLKVKEDSVLIAAVDKGNKDYRQKISKEFYKELLTIKEVSNSEYVFDVSKPAIQRMIEKFNKTIDKGNRFLVWHSVRKTGVSFSYKRSGCDILHAQKIANHSSPTVTQDYIADEDYGFTGAVSSKNEVDVNIIHALTHEEMIQLFDSCDQQTKLLLALKAKEIFGL